jgi:lipopolysaccharide transport system permease protein
MIPIEQEVIYTPDSEIKNPGKLFQELFGSLKSSRALAWRLFLRDIRAQYRQSFFGIAWAISPPLVTAAGFTLANNAGIINLGETPIPYPAYVMLGMVLWQTFVEAFNAPKVAIKTAKPLLDRVKFPHEAIILSQLGELFFNLGVKLLITLSIFLIFRAPVSWHLIFSPLAFINLILLGVALGLLLVPIINLIQDISRTIDLIVLAWFFLTPVTYPMPNQGLLAIVTRLNPVTPLLTAARDLITTGTISAGISFWIMATITPLLLVLGWIVYRLSMPFIIERIT